MDFKPLHAFTVDFADRVAAIDNARYSEMTKICRNIDLLPRYNNAPCDLSDIDYQVISALLGRSLRRIG